MEKKNQITTVTRLNIAAEVERANILYRGRLREPDFLVRIFDLAKLPSTDYRFNTAYDDIWQHMVNNTDWEFNWMYYDPRTNLLHCDDSLYLKFLAESLHPVIRSNQSEVSVLVLIYNNLLQADGYEMAISDDISGNPIYEGRRKVAGQDQLTAKRLEIKKYLDTAYVSGKIKIINDTVHTNTDIAIGTAKELLETTCKSILKQRGQSINTEWSLSQLLKATTAILDFKPKEAENAEQAEKSIRQILGGISSIVQGATELRNSYGSGHGKDADFKGLEIKYAKLFVGVISDIVILYLSTNGEEAELIEISEYGTRLEQGTQ